MKVTVKHISDYQHKSTDALGNEVTIDMTPTEEKASLSPTELLLSACASCSMIDMNFMLKKRKKSFTDFFVEVEGERAESHPKFFTKIHLIYVCHSNDISKEELYKLATLAVTKYCSVITSLRKDVALTWEVKIK